MCLTWFVKCVRSADIARWTERRNVNLGQSEKLLLILISHNDRWHRTSTAVCTSHKLPKHLGIWFVRQSREPWSERPIRHARALNKTCKTCMFLHKQVGGFYVIFVLSWRISSYDGQTKTICLDTVVNKYMDVNYPLGVNFYIITLGGLVLNGSDFPFLHTDSRMIIYVVFWF